MTYTIIEKKSLPKVKRPKAMNIDDISVNLPKFESISQIFVATMSESVIKISEEYGDSISVENLRMILNEHYKTLLGSAFIYSVDSNKVVPIPLRELDKEFKDFKKDFIDIVFAPELNEYIILKKEKGINLDKIESLYDIYDNPNIKVYSIFGDSEPIGNDDDDDVSDFIYNTLDVMASIVFYYDKDEKSINRKDITKLFNKFTKEYIIFEVQDEGLYKSDVDDLLSIEEYDVKLYEDAKIIWSAINDEFESFEHDNFNNLEKAITQSINKFNEAKVTILSNEGSSVIFDVKYNNGEKVYADMEDASKYERFIFRVGVDAILDTGGVVMIRVNTTVFDKDLPICEIYGYRVDAKGNFSNINYRDLRESYSIDSSTGLPIEVESNVIFCDLKGNKTGILID